MGTILRIRNSIRKAALGLVEQHRRGRGVIPYGVERVRTVYRLTFAATLGYVGIVHGVTSALNGGQAGQNAPKGPDFSFAAGAGPFSRVTSGYNRCHLSCLMGTVVNTNLVMRACRPSIARRSRRSVCSIRREGGRGSTENALACHFFVLSLAVRASTSSTMFAAARCSA